MNQTEAMPDPRGCPPYHLSVPVCTPLTKPHINWFSSSLRFPELPFSAAQFQFPQSPTPVPLQSCRVYQSVSQSCVSTVGALSPSSGASVSSSSVWFQVCVITVPIAGSIVLVILIFMATKVLRQDTKRQRQISEIRKQRHFKTHLLLNDGLDAKHHNTHHKHDDGGGQCLSGPQLHKPEKNETNAKINDLEKGCDISVDRHKPNNNGTNLCNIISKYNLTTINGANLYRH